MSFKSPLRVLPCYRAGREAAMGLVSAAVVGPPLDGLSNIAIAYSTRRLLTSYAGNLIRLRRDSDNGESDFGYDANGDLDIAAVAAWLGGATGYIVTWYDQSGNGVNATQGVAASQPRYDATGLNNKPSLEWFDANSRYLTYAVAFPTLAHCISTMATTYASATSYWGKTTTTIPSFRFAQSSNRPILYLGAANYQYFTGDTTYRDGNGHVHSIYIAGTAQLDIDNCELREDGTVRTKDAKSNAGATSSNASTNIGLKLTPGYMLEFVVFSAQLSTADHNQIGSAFATYAGATWNTMV